MADDHKSPCDILKQVRDRIYGNGHSGLVEEVRLNSEFRKKWQGIEQKITVQMLMILINLAAVGYLIFR